MAKLLWAAAILVVLLVGAALAVPPFVDWNAHRGAVAAHVEAAIGRPIAIDGDLALRLLPAPILSVGKVRVASPAGMPDEEMATVESLSVELALRPLLLGRIEAKSVVLMHPVVRLRRLADGRANWHFEVPADDAGGEAATGTAGGAARRDGGRVKLDRVRIENGLVEVRDALAGRNDRIERIHGEFRAESLAGPFEGAGDLVANGRLLSFSVSLGRLGSERPAPAAATVTLPGIEVGFSGSVGDARADGVLRMSGPDLADFIAAATEVAGAGRYEVAALHRGFAAEARITASAATLALDDLQIEVGGARASGAAGLTFGERLHGDLALSVPVLDLDRWLAAGRGMRGGDGASPGAAPSEVPSTDRGLPRIAVPEGFDLSLDLTATSVVWRGRVVQEGRLAANLAAGRLDFDLAADLPGAAHAEIAGTATPGAPFPRLDGRFALRADNLRGLLDWLDALPRGVPGDRLRTFAASGALSGDGKTLQATGIDLRLDTTSATGGIALALIDRLSFGLSLSADEFNLDAYRRVATEAAAAAGDPAADGSSGLDFGRMLDRFDANVQARIGQLDWNGTPVRDLRVNAVLYRGRLDLRELRVADLAGAEGSLVGEVFTDDRSGFGIAAQVDATAASLPRLLGALAIPPPAGLGRAGGASVKGTISGTAAAADLDLRIGLGRMKASFAGQVHALGPDLRYDGRIKVGGPRTTELLEMISPGYDAGGPSGAFDLAGRFRGSATDLAVSDLDVTVAGQRVSGIATVRWDGPRPAIGARLQGGTIAADALVGLASAATAGSAGASDGQSRERTAESSRWSGEPLDLGVLRAVDADAEIVADTLTWGRWRIGGPKLSLALDDGLLELRQLDGRVFDGAFAMTGRIAAAEPVPRLEAHIAVDDARIAEALFAAGEVALVEGTLDYVLDLAAAGASERALVASLSGEGRLDASDGRIRGFDVRRFAEAFGRLDRPDDLLRLAESAMADGSTRFARLSGSFEIADGRVRSDDIALSGDGITGSAALRADLPAWQLVLPVTFRLSAHPDAPPIGVTLEGSLDQPRRRLETAPIEAWAVEHGAERLLGKTTGNGAPGDGPESARDDAGELLQKLLNR